MSEESDYGRPIRELGFSKNYIWFCRQYVMVVKWTLLALVGGVFGQFTCFVKLSLQFLRYPALPKMGYAHESQFGQYFV
jgi:hypothetical protein